jgi:hypothetical protein
MRWEYWPETLVAVIVLLLEGSRWTPWTDTSAAGAIRSSGWTPQKKLEARYVTKADNTPSV